MDAHYAGPVKPFTVRAALRQLHRTPDGSAGKAGR